MHDVMDMHLYNTYIIINIATIVIIAIHQTVSLQACIRRHIDTDIACGICPLCLYSHEPCGFSTFLYVAVVTHMTLRDMLYKLHKVTSGTKQRDSCSSSLLLSNVPDLDRRYTEKNGA